MKFAHKPSSASSYDFLVLFIEIFIKNYIESWGQTFGTPDFDLRVRSVPASRSEVPGEGKKKIHNANGSIRGRYQRMES